MSQRADLPPVVLVHGMGSTFEHNWHGSGWVDLLGSEGREVVPFHLPGHGGSPPLHGPTDSASGRLLEAVSPVGPVDVVGFSAGAAAVLGALSSHPRAFRRAVLLGFGDTMLDRRTVGVPSLAGELDDSQSDAPASPVVRLLRQMIRTAGNDLAAVAAYARAMPPPPSLEQISHIDVPVLVGIGERDDAGPADRLLDALPDGRLLELRGTDHFSTTSSYQCQDAVLRFLSETESPIPVKRDERHEMVRAPTC